VSKREQAAVEAMVKVAAVLDDWYDGYILEQGALARVSRIRGEYETKAI
jgi:hypothetical protein